MTSAWDLTESNDDEEKDEDADEEEGAARGPHRMDTLTLVRSKKKKIKPINTGTTHTHK